MRLLILTGGIWEAFVENVTFKQYLEGYVIYTGGQVVLALLVDEAESRKYLIHLNKCETSSFLLEGRGCDLSHLLL